MRGVECAAWSALRGPGVKAAPWHLSGRGNNAAVSLLEVHCDSLISLYLIFPYSGFGNYLLLLKWVTKLGVDLMCLS